MALYLEGKTNVDTNDLSPEEATQMSHEVKYIGMDVHKEAIVIAVLNGSGKLVMETILETKASSIDPHPNRTRGAQIGLHAPASRRTRAGEAVGDRVAPAGIA